MTLIKGNVSLTRYKTLDPPPELTQEFLADRFRQNAFMDIDKSPEEESMGWVEVLNHFSTAFEHHHFHFGDVIILGFRVDVRKVSAKMVDRYLARAEAEADAEKPLNKEERRMLKAKIRHDLLIRTPVNTDVYEVCWFPRLEEVWLAASGTKLRERFEAQWIQTFNFGLGMKMPFILGLDHLPEGATIDTLDQAQPSALFGGAGN
ncbi:MAG: recombination-associated protein RdgC [Pseudomonadota bacterium]